MNDIMKYLKICRDLEAEIRNGSLPVGERLPGERELCKRFSVSRQTVIKALSLLKERGVLASRSRSGCFVTDIPHQNLFADNDRVPHISIISADLENSFGCSVCAGAQHRAAQAGYVLNIYASRLNEHLEAECLIRCVDSGVAGILLLPLRNSNRERVIRVATHIPLVCLDHGYAGADLPVVSAEHFHGAYLATRHLIERGHRRIGYLIPNWQLLSEEPSLLQRFSGYRTALEEAGIPFDAELISDIGQHLSSQLPANVGMDIYAYPAMNRLLWKPNRPTAVLLAWDELAPSAYSAIGDAGLRIPEDISVIGFNNDPFCTRLHPHLTSILNPGGSIGNKGVELLLDLIAGRKVPAKTELHVLLVERESVAPPPLRRETRLHKIPSE